MVITNCNNIHIINIQQLAQTKLVEQDLQGT